MIINGNKRISLLPFWPTKAVFSLNKTLVGGTAAFQLAPNFRPPRVAASKSGVRVRDCAHVGGFCQSSSKTANLRESAPCVRLSVILLRTLWLLGGVEGSTVDRYLVGQPADRTISLAILPTVDASASAPAISFRGTLTRYLVRRLRSRSDPPRRARRNAPAQRNGEQR